VLDHIIIIDIRHSRDPFQTFPFPKPLPGSPVLTAPPGVFHQAMDRPQTPAAAASEEEEEDDDYVAVNRRRRRRRKCITSTSLLGGMDQISIEFILPTVPKSGPGPHTLRLEVAGNWTVEQVTQLVTQLVIQLVVHSFGLFIIHYYIQPLIVD